MKINDVLIEGFWSSYGKALLPAAARKALDVEKPEARQTYYDLAKSAYEKYGTSPDYDADDNLQKLRAEADKIKDPELKKQFLDTLGAKSWYTKDQQDYAKTIDKDYREKTMPDLVKAAKAAIQRQKSPSAQPNAQMATPTTSGPPVAPASPTTQSITLGGYQFNRSASNDWTYNKQIVTDPAIIARLDKQAALRRQTAQMAPGYQPMPAATPKRRGKSWVAK